MSFINTKDYKTGRIVKALNFGGPKYYKISNRLIWAPKGGTSLAINENNITLEPLGLVIDNPDIWITISHQNVGTADWRITVKNLATGEEKAGVYPFKHNGDVYELECQPGTWVMASCGGYKIESSWSGQQSSEIYKLKGTDEIIKRLAFKVFAEHETLCLIPGIGPRQCSGYSVALPIYIGEKSEVGYEAVSPGVWGGLDFPFAWKIVEGPGCDDPAFLECPSPYIRSYTDELNSTVFPYKTRVLRGPTAAIRIYGKLQRIEFSPPNAPWDTYPPGIRVTYAPWVYLYSISLLPPKLREELIEELNRSSLDELLFIFGINPDKVYRSGEPSVSYSPGRDCYYHDIGSWD